MSKQRKLVLVSAGVGVISMFLPWVRVSVFGYSKIVNGLHGIGLLVCVCFIVIGIAAYLPDRTKSLNKNKELITIISGVVATLVIVWSIVSASESVVNSLGIGIYLAGLAAAGILIFTFLFRST